MRQLALRLLLSVVRLATASPSAGGEEKDEGRSGFQSTKKELKIKKQAGRGEVLVRMHAIGRGPKFLADTNYRGRRNNEDTDNNSTIGVTAHGVRPDGATTDDAGADADERNADYCAGEREEEGESRAGAEQTAGKT